MRDPIATPEVQVPVPGSTAVPDEAHPPGPSSLNEDELVALLNDKLVIGDGVHSAAGAGAGGGAGAGVEMKGGDREGGGGAPEPLPLAPPPPERQPSTSSEDEPFHAPSKSEGPALPVKVPLPAPMEVIVTARSPRALAIAKHRWVPSPGRPNHCRPVGRD